MCWGSHVSTVPAGTTSLILFSASLLRSSTSAPPLLHINNSPSPYHRSYAEHPNTVRFWASSLLGYLQCSSSLSATTTLSSIQPSSIGWPFSPMMAASGSFPVPPSKAQPQAPKKNTVTPGISLASGAVAGAVEAASTVRSVPLALPLSLLTNINGCFSIRLNLRRLARS